MSCEYLIDDFLNEIKSNVTHKFKILFSTQLLFAICISYFSFGLYMTYSNMCKDLNLSPTRYNDFWAPLSISYSITNIIGILTIAFYFYMSFKYRNFIEKSKSHQPEILFLIILPLYILSIIGLILGSIKNILFKEIYFPTIVFNFSSVVFFIGIVILLIEIRNGYDTGENWKLSFSKFTCIAYCSIGIINYVIFNMSIDQLQNFQIAINKENESQNGSVYFRIIQQSYSSIKPFMIRSIFLGGLISVIYMFEPLKKSYMIIDKSIEYNNEFGSLINSIQIKKISYFSIICSIAIFISILSTSILALLDESFYIYYHIIGFIVHFISFFLIGIQIHDLKYWKKISKPPLIDQCLISVGLVGCLIHGATLIEHNGFEIENMSDSLHIFCVIRYIVEIIQVILQTILEFLLINLENHSHFKNHFIEFLCPIFCLFSLNLGFFLNKLINRGNPDYFKSIKEFRWRLMETGFNDFGSTFTILMRFHAAILFGRYISQ